MFITSFMIIFMSITGVMLKGSYFVVPASVDMNLVRRLHNEFSVHFVIALTVMMVTGFIMYLFPLLRKKPSPQATPKNATQVMN